MVFVKFHWLVIFWLKSNKNDERQTLSYYFNQKFYRIKLCELYRTYRKFCLTKKIKVSKIKRLIYLTICY